MPPAWTDTEHKFFFEIIQKAATEAVSRYNMKNPNSVSIEISLGSEAEATTFAFAATNESLFKICSSMNLWGTN